MKLEPKEFKKLFKQLQKHKDNGRIVDIGMEIKNTGIEVDPFSPYDCDSYIDRGGRYMKIEIKLGNKLRSISKENNG